MATTSEPFIGVLAMHAGDPEEGARVLKPLRELGEPMLDMSGVKPYLDIQRILDEDDPNGRLYYWKSTYLSSLSDEVITHSSPKIRPPFPWPQHRAKSSRTGSGHLIVSSLIAGALAAQPLERAAAEEPANSEDTAAEETERETSGSITDAPTDAGAEPEAGAGTDRGVDQSTGEIPAPITEIDTDGAENEVSGRVVDADTQDPIGGARVGAEALAPGARGELLGEVATRADGTFEIAEIPYRELLLRARAEGYEPTHTTALRGEEIELSLSAAPADGAREVIDLVDRIPDPVEPTTYELDAETVSTLPGAAGDPLRAVQSLPGAARIPFNLGGLVLRGTDPRDTGVYLGDVEVPILFHFGGLRSFYPAMLLGDLEVSPGGFGAAYGRHQGGLVTLDPRDPHRDDWRFGGEVSLLDASAYAEGPAGEDGGVIAGLRRSYIDSILALLPMGDDTFLPRYWDGQLRYQRGDPGEGEWTASLFFSEDLITLDEGDDSLRFRLGFVRASASHRRRLGDYEARAMAWLGADRLRIRERIDGATTSSVRRVTAPAGVRADVLRDFDAGRLLAAGLDVQGVHYGGVTIGAADEEATATHGAGLVGDLGLWTRGRYRTGDGRFGATPGLRLDRSGLTGEWLLSPRVTLSQDVHARVTLRESAGLYFQPPNDLDLTDEADQDLQSGRMVHLSAGSDFRLPANLEAQITGFALFGDRQPVGVAPPSDWEADPAPRSAGGLGPIFQLLLEEHFGSGEFRESRGYARSFGVELGARGQMGPWRGMLSYTLSRALRTDDPERFSGWRPYELDQTHNLVAMISRRLGSWQLGGRFRYTTGNPYTPIVDEDAEGQPVEGDPLSARLPPHIQLDLRAGYAWQPRFGGEMRAFLDVQNATHRRNAEGVSERGQDPEYTRGLPIVPIIGLAYRP